VTEEIEGESDLEDSGGLPVYIDTAMQTAEIDVQRDKRLTLTSPISALLAESMRHEREDPTPVSRPLVARDAAAREPASREPVARDPAAAPRAAAPPAGEAALAPRRQRAALCIDQARAHLDAGDLGEAAAAAEAALAEADDAPPPGIIEVIEPARPLLARVFGGFVGPLGGVPVLAPRAHEVPRAHLGDSGRGLLARIDGIRTLEELFDGSGLGSIDALRIAARLIRAGAIRIV
jgi:hypothetical protein